MTTDLLERSETGHWKVLATVSRYRADAERETMRELHPARAKLIEAADKRGQLHRVPHLLIPHIEGDQMKALGFEPYSIGEYPDNLLCNAGINRLESLLLAAGGQAYDNTHSAIGVGDGAGSVPTAAATDTDLAAIVNASNRYFQMADSTYPSAASQVVTVQATFSTSNANFEWREWGIDQHTASGATASTAPLLNHKGVDLGLKTSAASWVFRVTITIS